MNKGLVRDAVFSDGLLKSFEHFLGSGARLFLRHWRLAALSVCGAVAALLSRTLQLKGTPLWSNANFLLAKQSSKHHSMSNTYSQIFLTVNRKAIENQFNVARCQNPEFIELSIITLGFKSISSKRPTTTFNHYCNLKFWGYGVFYSTLLPPKKIRVYKRIFWGICE